MVVGCGKRQLTVEVNGTFCVEMNLMTDCENSVFCLTADNFYRVSRLAVESLFYL